MPELNVDIRGEITFDDYGTILGRFPQYADRAMASALKSEGFRLKNLIRAAVRDGGPAGGQWPKRNPHTYFMNRAGKGGRVKNYRMVWKGKKGSKTRVASYKGYGHRESKALDPLRKLGPAARYHYDPSISAVTIGFLDPRMRGLAKMHAKGFSTPVTPRMRKMAFAVGFPLSKEINALVTPPRPLVGPIFAQEEKVIIANVKWKAVNALVRYMQGRYRLDQTESAA